MTWEAINVCQKHFYHRNLCTKYSPPPPEKKMLANFCGKFHKQWSSIKYEVYIRFCFILPHNVCFCILLPHKYHDYMIIQPAGSLIWAKNPSPQTPIKPRCFIPKLYHNFHVIWCASEPTVFKTNYKQHYSAVWLTICPPPPSDRENSAITNNTSKVTTSSTQSYSTTSPAVMSPPGDGELGQTQHAHGDTSIRNPEGSLGPQNKVLVQQGCLVTETSFKHFRRQSFKHT